MRVQILRAQCRVIEVATGDDRHARIEAAVDDDDPGRRMLAQANRFIDQVFVRHRLAATHAGIGGDHDFGPGVVDPRGKARGGEPAEYDRMNGADPRTRQHRKRRFGDHRHVNQHPVALAHALRLQRRGEAVHFGVQFAERVTAIVSGLGRDVDQRLLVTTRGEMTIDGVMTNVGAAADEPFGERRLGIVENSLERRVPLDQRRCSRQNASRSTSDRPVKLVKWSSLLLAGRLRSTRDRTLRSIKPANAAIKGRPDRIDPDRSAWTIPLVGIEVRRQVGEVDGTNWSWTHPGANSAASCSIVWR